MSQTLSHLPPASESAVHLFFRRDFPFTLALLVAAIVFYGFSNTADARLFHADSPRPWILWVHTLLFASWIIILIVQTALVRFGHTRLHMKVGIAGLLIGFAIPFVGVSTELVMEHFHVLRHDPNYPDPRFLAASLTTLFGFFIPFALTAFTRSRPPVHRRFMLFAVCMITVPGFERFPLIMALPQPICMTIAFALTDLVLLLPVLRDVVLDRQVSRIYCIGYPIVVASQAFAVYTLIATPSWYLAIARWMTGLG